ncbi:MAG: hypothetical protein ABSH11_13620 [Verrucomicrobiota bacterium]
MSTPATAAASPPQKSSHCVPVGRAHATNHQPVPRQPIEAAAFFCVEMG